MNKTYQGNRLGLILLTLALTLALAGCAGSGTPERDIAPGDAAASILEATGLDQAFLVPIPENLVDSYYAMDPAVTDYAIYIDGTGATSQEIAVLKTGDKSDLAKARAVVDQRLATLRGDFENYLPQQLAKIDDPVIVEKGNVIYMVLSEDNAKAEAAIDALYK